MDLLRGGAVISFFARLKKDAETALLSRLRKEKPLKAAEIAAVSIPLLPKILPFWEGLTPTYRQDFVVLLRQCGHVDAIFTALAGKNRHFPAEEAVSLIVGFGSEYFSPEIELLLFTESPCIPARLEEILSASAWVADLLPRLEETPLSHRVIFLAALAKSAVPGVASAAIALLPKVAPEKQLEILSLLGHCRDPLTVPILLEYLREGEWRAQIRAIHALQAYDDPLVLSHFKKAAASAEGPVAFALTAAIEEIEEINGSEEKEA